MTRKSLGLALAGCCGILTLASTASAQTIVIPDGHCVTSIPGNCDGPSAPAVDDTAAIAAARMAEAARVARAAAAFEKGQEALKKGNLRGAITFYRSARMIAPENPAYKKQLVAAEHALYQQRLAAGGDASALGQLQGAAIDGKTATGAITDDRARNTGGMGFDVGGTKVQVTPPPPTADNSVSGAIARGLGLPVNLADPANAKVASAMSKVEYMLKYNRTARIEGNFAPNLAALQTNVDELNKALPPGTPPVTVERVEAVYTGYQLKLRQAKTDSPKTGGQ